jgi:hypothetical protein
MTPKPDPKMELKTMILQPCKICKMKLKKDFEPPVKSVKSCKMVCFILGVRFWCHFGTGLGAILGPVFVQFWDRFWCHFGIGFGVILVIIWVLVFCSMCHLGNHFGLLWCHPPAHSHPPTHPPTHTPGIYVQKYDSEFTGTGIFRSSIHLMQT